MSDLMILSVGMRRVLHTRMSANSLISSKQPSINQTPSGALYRK
jgi:hypothetical protein